MFVASIVCTCTVVKKPSGIGNALFLGISTVIVEAVNVSGVVHSSQSSPS